MLSDPQKRAVYDQYGEEGLKGQMPDQVERPSSPLEKGLRHFGSIPGVLMTFLLSSLVFHTHLVAWVVAVEG